MKALVVVSLCAVIGLVGCSQETSTKATPTVAPGAMAAFEKKEVEVGCAMCVYGMEGADSCTLAAKIKDKPMMVKGAELDMHDHGLCSGAKRAVVSGKIEGGDLVASKVEIE
jgi:hypothetical protein